MEHHVTWCYDMLIDHTLPCNCQSYRNKVIALCYLCLAQCSTMLSTTIKYDIMKRYTNAASFITLNHKELDTLLGTRGLED